MKKRTIHGELMGKILKLRLLSCGAAGGCMVTGCMVTREGAQLPRPDLVSKGSARISG